MSHINSEQNNTLYNQISLKLLDYSQEISFSPNYIACFNISNLAIIELQKSYPRALITKLSHSDLENSYFVNDDASVDLLIANIFTLDEVEIGALLHDVIRILKKEGIFIFATFDSSSIPILKKITAETKNQKLSDEKKIFEQLRSMPSLHFSSFKEQIAAPESNQLIEYDVFFVSSPNVMLPDSDNSGIEDELSEENSEMTAEERLEKKEAQEEETENKEEVEEETENEVETELEEETEGEEEARENETENKEEAEPEEEIESKGEVEVEEEFEDKEELEAEAETEDKEEAEEEKEPEDKEEVEVEEETENLEDAEIEEETEAKEEAEVEQEIEDKEDTKEEPEDKEGDKVEEETEDEVNIEEKEMTEREKTLEKGESEETESHENETKMTSEKIDELKSYGKKLNNHAEQIDLHISSTQSILKQLKSENLDETERKVKMEALQQHHAQHEEMLAEYKSLYDQHNKLLSHFINSQDKTLGKILSRDDKYHELIDTHLKLMSEHQDKIQQHDELAKNFTIK